MVGNYMRIPFLWKWIANHVTNCKYNDCELFPAHWGRNITIFYLLFTFNLPWAAEQINPQPNFLSFVWSSLYYNKLLLLWSYRHTCQSQQLNFIIQTLFIIACLGSGGNNHAVDYYKETNYPLAVKLGTITPDGAGIAVYYVITSLPCLKFMLSLVIETLDWIASER